MGSRFALGLAIFALSASNPALAKKGGQLNHSYLLFAEGDKYLQLDFPANRMDRRTLPNGSEFLAVSGKVTNTGNRRRAVPAILLVLRDQQERIVFSMTIKSPKSQLNPRESVVINEAVLDIPKTAKVAEIGWKPD